MRKYITRFLSFILLFIFLFSSLVFFNTYSAKADVSYEERIYQSASQTLRSNLEARKPTEDILDYLWTAFDLVRSGQKDTDFFLKELVNTIIEKEGVLSTRTGTYSNYAKAVLTLTAYGLDATNIGGYNLIEAVSKYGSVIPQGINGVIYALIALDSGNYEIKTPDNYPITVTRDTYINAILSEQLDDGGWDYANRNADPDMTAMAIQALAPYYDCNDKVKTAVDKALTTLSEDLQQEDGGFQYADGRYEESSESTSMVILALTALGVNPATDPRFVKSGGSPIDNLYSYAVEGQGFKHLASGRMDSLATDQAFRALTAYHRLVEGKTSIYDMTDVGELSPVFTDVRNPDAWYFGTVYEIAKTRNSNGTALMSGYGGAKAGKFGPADPLTRQDFAIILYRLAGEPAIPDLINPFTDTSESGYYYNSVLWAKGENVIAGYNDGRFGVGDKITREQVATILYRFAKDYLHMDASEKGDLSTFSDGTAVSSWAEEALIWATGADIITGKANGTKIDARGNAARAEIAAMILRFIEYAK